MTVYVDEARIPWGRGKWCHMMADSLEELHRFASSIGLKQEWFQGRGIPHYDVTENKRELALQVGAIIAPRNKIAELIAKHKEESQ